MNLLSWDIYEISAATSKLNGVKLRGKIRKYALDTQINVIAENTTDKENGVRFAVLSNADGELISKYVSTIIDDAKVVCIVRSIQNPVLSKMIVNSYEGNSNGRP